MNRAGQLLKIYSDNSLLTGETADILTGLSLNELLPRKIVEQILEGLTKALAQDEMITVAFPWFSENREKWFEARLIPIHPDEGMVELRNGSSAQMPESQLMEKNRRYELVFKGTQEALWDMDLINDTGYCNDQFYEMLGLDRIESAGRGPYWDLIHPDDRQLVETKVKDHIQSREPYILQFRMRHSSGEYRYVFARAQVFVDEAGTPERFCGLVSDVTEKVLAEQALRESEERFRILANSAPIMIWMMEADQTLSFLNQHAMERIYLPLAKNLSSQWEKTIHPEDRQRVMQTIQNAIATKSGYRIEIRSKFADGQYHHLYCVATARFDEQKNFLGLIGTAMDITDLKDAQNKLMESEQRFRLMADCAPVMIWVLDAQGMPVYRNKIMLEYFGMLPEEMAQSEWFHHVHPDDLPVVIQKLSDALSEQDVYSMELRMIRHDGQVRWFNSQGVPRFNAQGEFLGLIGISTDITEIKLAKEIAESANHKKSQFLATMSHELRTPLNAIIGYSQMLELGIGGKPLEGKQLNYVKNVVTSGKHLLALVNDLLDLSKAEAGKIYLHIEQVDLKTIMDEIEALAEQLGAEQHIEFSYTIETGLHNVTADPVRLKQILLNLVMNAIKFNKDHGSVRVQWMCDERWVSCSIEDTGIGIPEDRLDELFIEFHQLDSSFSRYAGGTGLGLSLTKKLLELHGGTIEVKSKDEQGSCFIFRLPAST